MVKKSRAGHPDGSVGKGAVAAAVAAASPSLINGTYIKVEG